MNLSEKSRAILEAMAKGHTYEQILIQDLAWTYQDIFNAVSEVLALSEKAQPDKTYSLEDIRDGHPRAYEKWTSTEDADLAQRFDCGDSILTIARTLQRQPSAIKSRLLKLGKIKPD